MIRRVVIPTTVLVILLAIGMSIFIMTAVAFPPRKVSTVSPGGLLVNTQEMTLNSEDGLQISGQLFPGPGPAILLCHDFGSSKDDFLPFALTLREEGYTVATLDFRRHGKSAGRVSTLGARESLDVLAAIEFLRARSGQHVGLVGVGMGAYAGGLAASRSEQLSVLVLVDPYPDVETCFRDRMESMFGISRGPLPTMMHGAFAVVTSSRGKEWSLTEKLPALSKKSILFVSSEANESVENDIHRLYDLAPEPKELVSIRDFQSTLKYGADKARIEQRLLKFLREYLPPKPDPGKVLTVRD